MSCPKGSNVTLQDCKKCKHLVQSCSNCNDIHYSSKYKQLVVSIDCWHNDNEIVFSESGFKLSK